MIYCNTYNLLFHTFIVSHVQVMTQLVIGVIICNHKTRFLCPRESWLLFSLSAFLFSSSATFMHLATIFFFRIHKTLPCHIPNPGTSKSAGQLLWFEGEGKVIQREEMCRVRFCVHLMPSMWGLQVMDRHQLAVMFSTQTTVNPTIIFCRRTNSKYRLTNLFIWSTFLVPGWTLLPSETT